MKLTAAPKERPELDALIKRSIAEFNAMSPEEQEAMIQAQRESFARGNLAIDRGPDARRTVVAAHSEPGGRGMNTGYIITDAYDAGVVDGKQEDAAAERASIVEWLTRRAEGLYAAGDNYRARFYSVIAQEIERGDHAQPRTGREQS